MSTQVNISESRGNVKHGPFQLRSQAVEAGKQDARCRVIGCFTVIKAYGTFDYVPGANPVLFSSDFPQCRFHRNLNGEWRMELVK